MAITKITSRKVKENDSAGGSGENSCKSTAHADHYSKLRSNKDYHKNLIYRVINFLTLDNGIKKANELFPELSVFQHKLILEGTSVAYDTNNLSVDCITVPFIFRTVLGRRYAPSGVTARYDDFDHANVISVIRKDIPGGDIDRTRAYLTRNRLVLFYLFCKINKGMTETMPMSEGRKLCKDIVWFVSALSRLSDDLSEDKSSVEVNELCYFFDTLKEDKHEKWISAKGAVKKIRIQMKAVGLDVTKSKRDRMLDPARLISVWLLRRNLSPDNPFYVSYNHFTSVVKYVQTLSNPNKMTEEKWTCQDHKDLCSFMEHDEGSTRQKLASLTTAQCMDNCFVESKLFPAPSDFVPIVTSATSPPAVPSSPTTALAAPAAVDDADDDGENNIVASTSSPPPPPSSCLPASRREISPEETLAATENSPGIIESAAAAAAVYSTNSSIFDGLSDESDSWLMFGNNPMKPGFTLEQQQQTSAGLDYCDNDNNDNNDMDNTNSVGLTHQKTAEEVSHDVSSSEPATFLPLTKTTPTTVVTSTTTSFETRDDTDAADTKRYQDDLTCAFSDEDDDLILTAIIPPVQPTQTSTSSSSSSTTMTTTTNITPTPTIKTQSTLDSKKSKVKSAEYCDSSSSDSDSDGEGDSKANKTMIKKVDKKIEKKTETTATANNKRKRKRMAPRARTEKERNDFGNFSGKKRKRTQNLSSCHSSSNDSYSDSDDSDASNSSRRSSSDGDSDKDFASDKECADEVMKENSNNNNNANYVNDDNEDVYARETIVDLNSAASSPSFARNGEEDSDSGDEQQPTTNATANSTHNATVITALTILLTRTFAIEVGIERTESMCKDIYAAKEAAIREKLSACAAEINEIRDILTGKGGGTSSSSASAASSLDDLIIQLKDVKALALSCTKNQKNNNNNHKIEHSIQSLLFPLESSSFAVPSAEDAPSRSKNKKTPKQFAKFCKAPDGLFLDIKNIPARNGPKSKCPSLPEPQEGAASDEAKFYSRVYNFTDADCRFKVISTDDYKILFVDLMSLTDENKNNNKNGSDNNVDKKQLETSLEKLKDLTLTDYMGNVVNRITKAIRNDAPVTPAEAFIARAFGVLKHMITGTGTSMRNMLCYQRRRARSYNIRDTLSQNMLCNVCHRSRVDYGYHDVKTDLFIVSTCRMCRDGLKLTDGAEPLIVKFKGVNPSIDNLNQIIRDNRNSPPLSSSSSSHLVVDSTAAASSSSSLSNKRSALDVLAQKSNSIVSTDEALILTRNTIISQTPQHC